MAKKSKNLVDSFMSGLLQEAKEAVDSVTDEQSPGLQEISPVETKSSSIISSSYQDHDNISDIADTYHVHSRYVSPKYHDKVSPKYHDDSSTKKSSKSSIIISPSKSLSKTQTRIYLWFKDRGSVGTFNKPEIVKGLDIPYITVRSTISKLEKLGILKLIYDKCQKNYEYKLKTIENLKLSKNISIISSSYHDHNNITAPSLISSSSLLNKTTTCQDLQKTIEETPELKYWRGKGLKSQLVDTWAAEFSLSHGDIVESLCYAAFDLIDNDLENKKKIRNPLDWLYGILKKSGFYPKPINYKSHLEKQIEREKERLAEIKARTEELATLRKEIANQEHNLKFEEMLADEGSDLFTQCFEKIPSFVKKANKKSTSAYLAAMKKAYCEINDVDNF